MPRTKKVLNAEEAQEKVVMRKRVVAKYNANPRAKELAHARYLRYKNDPDSSYNDPKEGDALERQKRDQKKYYQKKKEERRIAEEERIAEEKRIAEEERIAEKKRIKRERKAEQIRIYYEQEQAKRDRLDRRINKLVEGHEERGQYGPREQSAKTRELVHMALLKKQGRLPSILSFAKK